MFYAHIRLLSDFSDKSLYYCTSCPKKWRNFNEYKKTNYDHDFSLTTVPEEEERKVFLSMLVVMLGFTFFSASMLTGGQLGSGLDLKTFFTSCIWWKYYIGNLYRSISLYILRNRTFNSPFIKILLWRKKGSYLVSFLLGGTQIGWFGVGVVMFSLPVAKLQESMCTY